MYNLLCVSTHPDDCEIWVGGILAKHALHYKVGLLLITGEQTSTYGKTRILEQEKSCNVLGIDFIDCLNIKENFVNRYDWNALSILEQIVLKYQPSIVLSPYYIDVHFDHIESSFLVQKACATASYQHEEYIPHKVHRIYYYGKEVINRKNIIIDVTDYWKTKEKALLSHYSQFGNSKTLMGRSNIDIIKKRDKIIGNEIKSFYAECLLYDDYLVPEYLYQYY